MADYRDLFAQLFHHIPPSSCPFAIASDNLGADRLEARDYLQRRAARQDEQRWQLSDAPAEHPSPDDETAAFLALDHYVAQRMPLATLAIAAMQETVNARFDDAVDMTPPEEIFEILRRAHPTAQEWQDVIWATEVATVLYQRMRAAPPLHTHH